jgi:hypothetical protein
MSKYPWIGLTGRMAAGKDYTFRELYNIDNVFERVSFADQVRQELDELLEPRNPNLFYEKPYSPEIRALLQFWGTDYRRREDPDYWIKAAVGYAERVAADGMVPVFTDVRFPNEADAIRTRGGAIIRLKAMEHTRHARGATYGSHLSETAMDDYEEDFSLWNDDGAQPGHEVYRWLNLRYIPNGT